MIITIVTDDSLTPPWAAALDRDALVATVGGGIKVEGPATVPVLAMCEAMRCSMWACCSGVNIEAPLEGFCRGASRVDVILGSKEAVAGDPGSLEAGGALLP